MLSEVLLVCELLLFITLSVLTGGKPPSGSTHNQRKQSQVCTLQRVFVLRTFQISNIVSFKLGRGGILLLI